jgi:rhodanese-related sulfurtransferase
VGGKVSFESFLKPEYLGSSKGSSVNELNLATLQMGFYALPVQNITGKFLRDLKYPLILHVKRDLNSREYDHFVVCLRTVQGGGRIFDPPEPIETVPFEEIMRRSDGIGLLVSASPIAPADVFASQRRHAFIFAAAIFAAVVIFGFYRPKRIPPAESSPAPASWILQSLRQATAIGISTIALGLSFNFLSSDGLLASPAAREVIAPSRPVEIIDRQQFRALLEKGDLAVVDARFGADFAAGHVPGAVSIPVDTGDNQRREAMHSILPDRPIVVYCQSKGCTYADLVAAGLRSDGHARVLIYRGGWVDWAQDDKTPAKD